MNCKSIRSLAGGLPVNTIYGCKTTTGFSSKFYNVLAIFVLAGTLAGLSAGILHAAPLPAPGGERAGTIATPSGCRYINATLTGQPLAFFPLDNKTEGSVVNGYTLAAVGTPTLASPGAPLHCSGNKTLSLDGNNSYLTSSLSGGIPGEGSMVAWVNLAELPSDAGRYFYIAGESQEGNDFDLQFENDNNLYFYTGGGENTSYSPDPTTLVGQWHMIVVTYMGGSSGFRNIYWDGQLVAPFTGGVNAAPKTTQFSIGYSLVFGGRAFQGDIDDVAVFDFPLTSAQVLALAKSSL